MAMAEKSEADAESLAAISEKAVVESLGKLSGSLSCRFSCGGELSSPDKIQLVYKNEAGELRELVFPEASDADMQQLLDACSVASFGIDDQQVTDTSYRNALKLDPDHFTTSFQVADTPIQLAAMLLMPNVQGIRPSCTSSISTAVVVSSRHMWTLHGLIRCLGASSCVCRPNSVVEHSLHVTTTMK